MTGEISEDGCQTGDFYVCAEQVYVKALWSGRCAATCSKGQALCLTLTQSMVGAKHVTMSCPAALAFFASWQEPVLRVMVMEGEMMTAGFWTAGSRVAGAQNLSAAGGPQHSRRP